MTTTTAPTQMCDHCGIGPFFYVADRDYPTLCLDDAAEAARVGLLTFVEGNGTSYFPPIPKASAPGPFAFVRSPDEIAADAENHAADLRSEHDDGSWRDR